MMTGALPVFDLLETIRWTPPDRFFLLDRHLRRLQRSAAYFHYECSEAGIRRQLDRAVAGSAGPQRVRLLVSSDGTARIECTPLGPKAARPATLGIAATPIDPADVFLFHKTTHRGMYTDRAQPECDDVILWTAGGDVTETTIANLVVEIDGRKITPPASAGLLPGTFREELLERGEIVEGRLTLDDVKTATRVWMINSVREWWAAEIRRPLPYIEKTAAAAPSSASTASPTPAKRSQR